MLAHLQTTIVSWPKGIENKALADWEVQLASLKTKLTIGQPFELRVIAVNEALAKAQRRVIAAGKGK
eukprot:4063517-Heterocapsa_arctica.AAC.1